jgi:hypothetical protein
MKRTASARGSSRLNASWTRRRSQRAQFVICITDSAPDLEPRKVYKVVPDESAAKSNYLRIVDESGEDYLYPANYFVKVDLPKGAKRALLVAR